MYKVTHYGWGQLNQIIYAIVHYLFGSESPRREVYGEGLLMPGAGFLREYREGVGLALRDSWGTLSKCTSNQMPSLT